MAIIDLKADKYVELVAGSQIPVLIDFYATWCGPCKMLAPHIEALSEEFQGKIMFFRVNVDDEPKLAEIFNIAFVPTLEIMKGGERIAEQSGYMDIDALREFINKNI